MKYISVSQYAEKYGVSERTARNYCANGKIEGAFLTGNGRNDRMYGHSGAGKSGTDERNGVNGMKADDLTYNSNHIEGSRLTHDQTRYIFETNTIGITDNAVNVDDILETINHFRCIDYIIDHTEEKLTEEFIKQLHALLKAGTSDSRKDWFAVGDYKRLPNEVGGMDTCPPIDVHRQMKTLLSEYNHINKKSFEDILDFHVRFEQIHPFQDGNGRVGRLLMFKECMANGHVPFIITDELKMF